MPFVDLSQLLTSIIALAVIFLPVELYILLQVRPIRNKVDKVLEKPDLIIAKVADQLWQKIPITQLTDQLWQKIPITQLTDQLWQNIKKDAPELIQSIGLKVWEPLSQPDSRQKLISELGHGLVRVLKENEGSLKGIATRQLKSEALELLKTGGGGAGALNMLPGKVELPVVGKVSAGEAIQIGLAIKDLLTNGGRGVLGQGQRVIDVSGAGAAGYPK